MQHLLKFDNMWDAINNLHLKNILDVDKNSYRLFIEKHFIVEVLDFMQALTMLVVLIYVFNVAYSAKLISLYSLLQKIA